MHAERGGVWGPREPRACVSFIVFSLLGCLALLEILEARAAVRAVRFPIGTPGSCALLKPLPNLQRSGHAAF